MKVVHFISFNQKINELAYDAGGGGTMRILKSLCVNACGQVLNLAF